jgi:hypothetical protein
MQYSMTWWLALALGVMLTGGCGSAGGKKKSTLDTPSGAPEVVIASAQPDPILAASRKFFAGRGYVESPSRHAYELVFDRRTENSRKSQALRVRLRAAPLGTNTWRLAGTSLKVDGWQGDLASETLVPHGFPQIQGFLEAIKAQVESAN